MDTEMIDMRPAIAKNISGVIISLGIIIFAIIATIIYANKKNINKKKKVILILIIWVVTILLEILIDLVFKPNIF